jgi:hypothetical protein
MSIFLAIFVLVIEFRFIFKLELAYEQIFKMVNEMEQHVLDTYAGKHLS